MIHLNKSSTMLITKNIDRLPISLSTEQIVTLTAAVTTRNAISDAITAISGTPAHEGIVYVLWRIGQTELYVGSTLMKLRARFRAHRTDSIKHPNQRVYKHINENGGFVPSQHRRKMPIEPSEDAFGILEIARCRVHGTRLANKELGALERVFTEVIEPVLNLNAVALTPVEYMKRRIESNRKTANRNLSIRIKCGCGGRTSLNNKSAHESTKMHQRWLAQCQKVESQ